MRDPLVRWWSTGLILALPVLIRIVAATSSAGATDLPSGGSSLTVDPVGAVVLGLVEVVVAAGLWLAARERERLGVR